MKHGPIALVDEHTPSVFLMPHGPVYDKVMANMEEIKARGGPVIAIVGEGDTRGGRPGRRRDRGARRSPTSCSRSSAIIPLQLLAYHIAVAARLRRRQAAESGEERDGGVTRGVARPEEDR